MRTLQDNNKQLERRTAIIGRELARYNITIAALNETRLPDESQLEEKGAGYTFFWIGKPANDHRQAGVSFAIQSSYLCHIDKLPKGVSERLMTMRIRLSGKNYARAGRGERKFLRKSEDDDRQSSTQRQVDCAW